MIGLFLFGSRDKYPSSQNNFINNYYYSFTPKGVRDYSFAVRQLFSAHFEKYIGIPKEVEVLNEMLIKGNVETFDFYEHLSRMGTAGRYPSFLKTVEMNLLMQNIVAPASTWTSSDNSVKLRRLSSSTQAFQMKLYSGTSFEVNKREFDSAVLNGRLTTDAYHSWTFGFKERRRFRYNDFNIVWNMGLDNKVKSAFKELENMFKKVPVEDTLRIEFLGRTTRGIDANYKISTKKDDFPTPQSPYGVFISPSILFNTEFDRHEIVFDPNNDAQRSEAIISMLVLMIMEPNVFINIKVGVGSKTLTPGDNFLNLDIYDLYDNGILQEGEVRNRVDGAFVWRQTGAGAVLTEDAFLTFKADFEKIFQYRDIMHFAGFNNHERDNRDGTTMYDYIKAKLIGHFRTSGKLNDGSRLFDPRELN